MSGSSQPRPAARVARVDDSGFEMTLGFAKLLSSAACCSRLCGYKFKARHMHVTDGGDKWQQSIVEEIVFLTATQTWAAEHVPEGVHAMPKKQVYKVKRHANGDILESAS